MQAIRAADPVERLGDGVPERLRVLVLGKGKPVEAARNKTAANEKASRHAGERLLAQARIGKIGQLRCADIEHLRGQRHDRPGAAINQCVALLHALGRMCFEQFAIGARHEKRRTFGQRVPVRGIEEADTVADHGLQTTRRCAALVSVKRTLDAFDGTAYRILRHHPLPCVGQAGALSFGAPIVRVPGSPEQRS